MNQRAWSTLAIKSVDEESRTITGIASTPSTDRMGDIVEPMGAEFALPLPFLWQHDSAQPIGNVISARPTKDGIPVVIQLAKSSKPGTLKDRLDEAWESIQLKLVRGLSIGFAPIERSYLDDSRGIHYTKWQWLELSAVTIPANADASIQTVKRFDIASQESLKKKRVMIQVPVPRQIQVRKETGVSGNALNAHELELAFDDALVNVIKLLHSDSKALAKRIKTLETKESSESGTVVKGVARFVRGLLDPLAKRIETLEAENADFQRQLDAREHKGVWSDTTLYVKHNSVTHAGSLWICREDDPSGRPGECDAWQLAVKRGRDGR